MVQLADGSGNETKTYDYDAFGNERNPVTGDANPWRYCGEYYDAETGTIYLRARYYNPATGRFLAEDTHWNPLNSIYGDNPQDPLGLGRYIPDINAIRQSSNLYSYCGANPILYCDPTGEIFWLIPVAIGVGATLLLSGCSVQGIRTVSPHFTGGNKTVTVDFKSTTVGNNPPDVYISATLYRGDVAVGMKNGTNSLSISASTAGVTAYWRVEYTISSDSTTQTLTSYNILFNKSGIRYPGPYTDPKSGKMMGDPASLNWAWVSPESRTKWTTADRNKYRTWYENSYNGGKSMDWTNLQIHHIRPLEYGGTNDYSNLIVLPKSIHQSYTSWWAGY